MAIIIFFFCSGATLWCPNSVGVDIVHYAATFSVVCEEEGGVGIAEGARG
jgi:hypothetical protein